MKKLIAFLTSLALLCCFAYGCSSNSVDKKPNVFSVGIDQDYYPLTYVDDNGQYSGFDVELAKCVADELNMQVEFIPIKWDEKTKLLEDGDIDCIWSGFSVTAQRQNAYTWSVPYMQNRQIIVVNKNSNFENQKDLIDKTLVAQKSSSSMEAIKANSNISNKLKNVIEANTQTEVLDKLSKGQADAGIIDEIAYRYYVKQNNKDEFRVLGDAVQSEQFAVGFKLGNTDLRDKVSNILNELASQGKIQELSKKYFGKDITAFDNNDLN